MAVFRKWFERSWSTSEAIILVALFATIAYNQKVFSEVLSAFGGTWHGFLFVGAVFTQLLAVLILILSALCHRALLKPTLIVFLLLSSVLSYFGSRYGTIFDAQMIANVLETDAAEAGDLLNHQLVLSVVLLGVLPAMAVWLARIEFPPWRAEIWPRLKLAVAALAAIVLAYLPFAGHTASLLREHRQITRKVIPVFALSSAVKLAVGSFHTGAQAHIAVGADAKKLSGSSNRKLVIFVVGETVRADHWGLNGYARNTTPNLSRLGIVNFPDFWSCDTSTATSVPCMFSNLTREGFDRTAAANRDNVLDVLARAGVSVLWRDNNSSSKGVADRVTYQNFKTPERNPICQDGECRDEGMLHGLQDYIDSQSGDILIVLHQMGNHGPAYFKRYPKSFQRFTPICSTNDLGSCSAEEIANAYDNAILYTDDLLSKVIDVLKSNEAQFDTAMFYVSDHGESLGEYGIYLHGMPYALAPEAQKHVPAVMWFGDRIKRRSDFVRLEERRKQHWSHDNIYATLLGLFDVGTKSYDPAFDILADVIKR